MFWVDLEMSIVLCALTCERSNDMQIRLSIFQKYRYQRLSIFVKSNLSPFTNIDEEWHIFYYNKHFAFPSSSFNVDFLLFPLMWIVVWADSKISIILGALTCDRSDADMQMRLSIFEQLAIFVSYNILSMGERDCKYFLKGRTFW